MMNDDWRDNGGSYATTASEHGFLLMHIAGKQGANEARVGLNVGVETRGMEAPLYDAENR